MKTKTSRCLLIYDDILEDGVVKLLLLLHSMPLHPFLRHNRDLSKTGEDGRMQRQQNNKTDYARKKAQLNI